jgi:hypothetical protein
MTWEIQGKSSDWYEFPNPEQERVFCMDAKKVVYYMATKENVDNRKLKNILCAGGTHFERGFSSEIFNIWDGQGFGISHIIPNQWLVSGEYENESGLEKLRTCVGSIEGGVQGIAMHDGLKGAYKQQLRNLGEELGIPVFKHQFLRKPESIQWTK